MILPLNDISKMFLRITNNFSNYSNRLESLSNNTDYPSDDVSILITAHQTTIKNNTTTIKLMIFGEYLRAHRVASLLYTKQ